MYLIYINLKSAIKPQVMKDYGKSEPLLSFANSIKSLFNFLRKTRQTFP